ncbi:MAG: Transketolase domain protein [Parcubacteria group bacterium GW2011_GWA1_59_11]|nr:MAG: Transketolase domain protein [Parcubacteria group bacterium GW2011_GWA1_59_11]
MKTIRKLLNVQDLHEKKIRFLEETANFIRQDVVKMLTRAGSGHSAGPLGLADVFTAFYFHILNHDPKRPNWAERDRLVLSNGHVCPVLYAALARAGYFPHEELATLRKLHSRLQGHPHRGSLPGVETTSGPLGSGLSQAIGMALAARLDGKRQRIYCLMSDAEQQEGNVWEAAMFAGKNKLSNLTALIDRNNIQIDGFTEDVMPLEPLREKYEAFNWHVLEIDGHSFEAIISAAAEARAIFEKPTLIIAHTVPGRGVSFMEQNYSWHGRPPSKRESKQALHELRTLGNKIRSEHQ